ncbi:MAG TPA: DUF2254 domain-containing protein [Stellaceae bacterium]|nr:DUF2254 domain-containing protein [Stellaceae bacterium]
MPTYLIPMVYVCVALVAGWSIPRFERAHLSSYLNDVAINSALATLGAIASGMMALTAIVFSIAYITVQFNAIAYSPRLALWFANDPRMFHALGIFMATFIYALFVMAWVDRGNGGGVPLISSVLVACLMVASMWVFTMLVRGLSDLQITNTLHFIGDKGREVIAQMYPHKDTGRESVTESAEYTALGPATQTIRYLGKPRTIARIDIATLVRMAEQADAVIELAASVGDTLSDDTLLLSVYSAKTPIPEQALKYSIHLRRERTFEQDPKYALRLLVDVAIKALSAAINDPTTAVQAIDQIEDLLRRLGRQELDAGHARDGRGNLRLVFPMPTWEDYLRLAFDEIRQYGTDSVQVMRRLRSALRGVAEAVTSETRTAAVQKYLKQLDLGISRSELDEEDRLVASQEDRQGLGLSRKRTAEKPPPVGARG